MDRKRDLPPEPETEESTVPFWRTTKGIIGIVLLILVIIAAVVGGVVGATHSKKSGPNASGGNSGNGTSGLDSTGSNSTLSGRSSPLSLVDILGAKHIFFRMVDPSLRRVCV